MNQRHEKSYQKAIGLMQSSSVRPLRIITDSTDVDNVKVHIKHNDDTLGTFSYEEYSRLTVHQILQKMGVPINERAN